MENNNKRRRIKVDPSKRKEIKEIAIPTLDSLIANGLSIIGSELDKYQSKVQRGITLDLKEARVIQGYLETMTKLSKEAREAARAQDLADLSDEELVQLAAQLSKTKKISDNSGETE